jgi:hypothetical protein
VTRFEKNVTLDVTAIKRRLNEASKSGNLPNVTFREIPRGPLDEPAPFEILAESQAGTFRWQRTYGPGLAQVAFVVTDAGGKRLIQLDPLGSEGVADMLGDALRARGGSFGDTMRASREQPRMKSSTKLAEAILALFS